MTDNNNRYPRSWTAAALLMALAAGVYVALHLYTPVVVPILDVIPPFAIALVFAFLLDPVVDWFQRHGRSREFGVAIVGIAFIVVFLSVGFLLVPRVIDQARQLAENMPAYTEDAKDALDKLLVREKPLLERLRLPTTLSEWSSQFSNQIEQAASTSLTFVAGTLTTILSRILWVIIIPLATLWLLRDLDYIKAKVVHFTPERHKERLRRTSAAVGGVFGKYIRGMLAVAIIFSAVSSIVLSVAGLQYALIIGGISGLLYLVPYIGTMMIIVATGIAALSGHSFGYAGILMGIIAVQGYVIFDQMVTPKVVGGSVGIHPVLSLFALALGARLFGVVGMVAAVPVAAAFQVALGQYYPHIFDKLERSLPKGPAQTSPE